MNNDERDDLDDLIDGALCGYAAAEPLAGLEERVLSRVRTANAARRRPWLFGLSVAVPALAAVLAIGVALLTPRHSERPAANAPKVAVAAPPVSQLRQQPLTAQPRATEARHRRAAGHKRAAPARSPKLESFPAAAPLAPEERALLAWAQRAPGDARQTFSDLRKRADEPLSIEAIQIQPLKIDGAH